MKKIKIIIAIAFIFSIISSSTFAVQTTNYTEQTGATERDSGLFGGHKEQDKSDRDPIKRLEERKKDIQKEYKEGKITKDKADELTKKIDDRIAKCKEFNSLTLPEKKERLNQKFKAHIEQDIKDKKITKEQADKMMKEFNEQLQKWDGKDFPRPKDKSHR